MTLPEGMSVPAAVLVGLLVVALIAILLRGVRTGSREQDAAQVIAAVQAERDALRANHAVEIATLEGKLAEAKARIQRELDAALRLKEVERNLVRTREEAERRGAEINALNDRLAALAKSGDEGGGRAAEQAAVVAERDRLRGELARQGELVADLRRQLQDAIGRASRASADRESHGDALAALARERDAAAAEAARAVREADALRAELQAATARLEQATAPASDEAELAAAHEREAELRATVREREGTIAELREALKARDGGGVGEEVRRLGEALAAVTEREKAANESLSRLAYERDGLVSRIAAAERTESQAKAEVEKHEALLELRLQKIYALEAKLRDQHAMLSEAQRRAAAAEETAAALRQGGDLPPPPPPAPDAEMKAKVEALQARIDEIRGENVALLDELEALRQAASTDGESYGAVATLTAELDAARRELASLRQENGRLKSASPAADPAELEAAKREAAALAEEVARLKAGEGEGAGSDAEAARRDLLALRRENARLKAEAATESGAAKGEIEALKARIRELAERFVDGGDMPPPQPEQTLADRIRAFKASRSTNAGA